MPKSLRIETYHRFVVPLEVTIRACRKDDLPRLEWYGMFTPHREIFHSAWERHQRGENLMLVADSGDFPIGQVWIDLAKKRPAPTGVVWALRVFPFLKQQGIGHRLMQAAEEALHRRGFRQVEVGVEKGSPAFRFYERLGYRRSGTLYEEYSYTTPDGVALTVPVDQIVYHKELPPHEADEPRRANSRTVRRPLDDW